MIAYAYALYLHILGDTHSFFYTQIFSIRVRISSQSSMSPEGADHSRMDMMDTPSARWTSLLCGPSRHRYSGLPIPLCGSKTGQMPWTFPVSAFPVYRTWISSSVTSLKTKTYRLNKDGRSESDIELTAPPWEAPGKYRV